MFYNYFSIYVFKDTNLVIRLIVGNDGSPQNRPGVNQDQAVTLSANINDTMVLIMV